MALLKIFSAKDPREYEQKGDGFFEIKSWGKAKIEYDRALDRLEKTSAQNHEFKRRLQAKIRQTKEALALEHKQSAEELMQAGYHNDARELLNLALELTENPELKIDLDKKLDQIEQNLTQDFQKEASDFDFSEPQVVEPDLQYQGDEYFRALCGTLPEDVHKVYLSYGHNFKEGYLALNHGNFELAADYLARAMEENPAPQSYIPLELATAYLNLEKHAEALQLLETFIEYHPDALPGYQLLCEIFWEMKAFDRAETLLASVPEDLAESVAVYLLRGETLFQAGKFSDTKSFYHNFLATYGWNEYIARALAKSFEALGEMESARELYGKIIEECRSCRSRIDPLVKQRYADLCFASGQYTTAILELYLSLIKEIPDNAADYYQKISRIYSAQGNDEEARRFRAFSHKANARNL